MTDATWQPVLIRGADLIVAWLPHAEDVTVAGADHSLALTHPGQVATALADFLERRPIAGSGQRRVETPLCCRRERAVGAWQRPHSTSRTTAAPGAVAAVRVPPAQPGGHPGSEVPDCGSPEEPEDCSQPG
jgi:hypothetical protein